MSDNNNEENELVAKLLKSDFIKTLVAIVMTTLSMSYFIFSATNSLKDSIRDMQYKIELNNQSVIFRLKNIEERQERDFKYINDNFVKKSDLKNK